MTKSEAAEVLGVSVRAVERYASAGRLPSRYVRGRTGQVLDFEAADVERFIAELAAPVERERIEQAPDTENDDARQAPTQGPTTALARLDGAKREHAPAVAAGRDVSLSDARTLLAALASVSGAAGNFPTSVPIADKLLLTLGECQQLTGLSRDTLRDATATGALPSRKIGRALRVKRADLERFIAEL